MWFFCDRILDVLLLLIFKYSRAQKCQKRSLPIKKVLAIIIDRDLIINRHTWNESKVIETMR